MAPLTFWFEFASTYSYVAAWRVESEARARGIDVTWNSFLLAPIFGANVLDVPVSTHEPPKADFFTHTAYWDITRDGGRKAPHIVALRQAINLEDA